MRISLADLAKKIQEKPEVPPFHFPSWDYLYMRDIRKMERWMVNFLQAFEEFETELRERLREVQKEPARFSAEDILEEILGEKESSREKE